MADINVELKVKEPATETILSPSRKTLVMVNPDWADRGIYPGTNYPILILTAIGIFLKYNHVTNTITGEQVHEAYADIALSREDEAYNECNYDKEDAVKPACGFILPADENVGKR